MSRCPWYRGSFVPHEIHIAFVIELSVAEYAGTELPDGAKAVEVAQPDHIGLAAAHRQSGDSAVPFVGMYPVAPFDQGNDIFQQLFF